MADVGIVQIASEGWMGGPGINTFAFSRGLPGALGDWETSATQFVEELADVYNALESYAVDGVTYSPTGIVSVYDEATGALQGVGSYGTDETWPITTDNPIGFNNESRATQLVVAYTTAVIKGNRVLRGRSYLGPVGSAAIDADGQVVPTAITAIQTAYGSLTSGAGVRLAVWGRPNGPTEGKYGDVTGVTVRSRPGVLRSRRD